MGNSAQSSNDTMDSLSEFKLTYRENGHDQFGHVAVYHHPTTGEMKLMKEVSFDADIVDVFLSSYIKARSFKRSFFTTAKVIDGSSKQESRRLCSACGAVQTYSVVCDKIDRHLLGEILYRSTSKPGGDFFHESELWYILSAILEVEEFIESSPKKLHGNLRLNSVLLSNDGNYRSNSGQIKFLDPILLFPKDNNYTRSFYVGGRAALSPEEIKARSFKDTIPKVNAEACEVWTIGIILLCCGSLIAEDSLYCWKDFSFNWHLQTDAIKFMRRSYSAELSSLVDKCVSENPEDRPTLNALRDILSMQTAGDALSIESSGISEN